MIPESILMMFMDSMREFMDNDVVSELFWKSHEFNIQTNSISMATASPSRLLMTTGNTRIGKSEVLRQFHGSVREVRFCEKAKLYELICWKRSKSWLMFLLFFYPYRIFCHKGLYFSLRNPLWRTHDNLSSRKYSEAHTTKSWDTDKSKGTIQN